MTTRLRWLSLRHKRLAFVLVTCGITLPQPVTAQSTGTLSGRVVDSGTGQPIPDVAVVIPSIGVRGLTNRDGFFVLLGIPEGGHDLVFDHLSYGRHTRQVSLEADDELVLEARLSQMAIRLAPLVVEALSELERRRVTSGFSMNEVRREEVELAQRKGQTLAELLRDRLPGAELRTGQGGSACLESRGFRSVGASCRGVTVMLDGVQIAAPGSLYRTMPLDQIERIELLSPGQAGARYGSAGGRGVLMVETRQGPRLVAPNPEERTISGFDWSAEAEPYSWKRVFGSSFAATTIGIGTGLLLARQCLNVTREGSLGLRTRCNGAVTAGLGFLSLSLPAAGGALGARRAGRTDRSEGRLTVSAVATTLVLTSGYLLLIHGGDVSTTAGVVVLSIGVPAATTLADRAFRLLR